MEYFKTWQHSVWGAQGFKVVRTSTVRMSQTAQGLEEIRADSVRWLSYFRRKDVEGQLMSADINLISVAWSKPVWLQLLDPQATTRHESYAPTGHTSTAQWQLGQKWSKDVLWTGDLDLTKTYIPRFDEVSYSYFSEDLSWTHLNSLSFPYKNSLCCRILHILDAVLIPCNNAIMSSASMT